MLTRLPGNMRLSGRLAGLVMWLAAVTASGMSWPSPLLRDLWRAAVPEGRQMRALAKNVGSFRNGDVVFVDPESNSQLDDGVCLV